MRKTAHLIASDDAPWLLPLFEPAIAAWSRRRLGQLGMEASAVERGQRTIRRALGSDGPLTRRELGERLEREGIALNPQTRGHMFGLAVTSGLALQGPDRGAQPCLVLRADWLPPSCSPHDPDAALRELARRYLRAFGPATEADFAGWSGLPLRDVRAGLNGIAPKLREVRLGGDTALALKSRARRAAGPIIRLLPAFDTFLMGWRDRGFIATGERWSAIGPGGGLLHPTIVRDGRALGTWKAPVASRREVELDLFEPVDAETQRAVDAEVADISRFEAG
jgi:hypothetical protein